MIGIDFSIGSAIVSTCAKIGGELMSAVGAFAKDLVTGPIPGITPSITNIVLGKILTLVIDAIISRSMKNVSRKWMKKKEQPMLQSAQGCM